MQTTVHFDTIFGQTISKIEEVINETERLLENEDNGKINDELTVIAKFRKNIEQGSYFYVGFAISNGFQSIDYQDPDSGNTFLHIAVRRGHVKVVEELLKYKANPDVKNKLGNYPIHEAWLFWKTHTLRTKEERLDQEHRTCQILLHLLSYGAYVDASDLSQQTPLHLACRLGTVKAVKVILAFRCDLEIVMKDGRSASDIALEFDQRESYKLLQAWSSIRSYLLHTDFHAVWHAFLHDFEADMAGSRPAEAIMSELALEQSARQMARAGREGAVVVDDPLLLQAMQASRKQDAEGKAPKPWEKGWKEYAKQSKAAGVVSLRAQLESLQGEGEGKGKGKKEPRPHAPLSEAEKRRNLLPDRPAPPTWSQRQGQLSRLALQEGDMDAFLSHFGNAEESTSAEEKEEQSPSSDTSPSAALSLYDGSRSRQPAIQQRRRAFAQQVALDAKFLQFTKRTTQQSALGLPLRTSKAPMQGTEEGNSAMRMILSQGLEFERLEKYKKKSAFAELLLLRGPVKNVLGAYSEGVALAKPNPRDILYDSLHLDAQAVALERAAKATAAVGMKDTTSSAVEPEKRAKIDLVNGRRPRYVDKALLPVRLEPTLVEKMVCEHKAREEAEQLKKQSLSSERSQALARLEMEHAIADAQKSLDSQSASALLMDNKHRRREATGKQQSLNRMFLQKKEVKYGQGRLTSSHNLTGRLEEPWTTVGGRYTTLPGDRTV